MRKTWKRALGLLLALCLLVSAMPAALAAGGSDLRGHWAEAAFTAFVEAGYVNGYPDGSYRPDQFVTRAEFMKLVNQVAGLTATSAAVQQYKDVKSSAWYYNEVSKALAEGYIQGKSASLMEPEANITRQEAITMVARVSGLKNGNLSVLQQYADRDQLAQWAEDAAAAMTEAQRLEGDPDHNLRPLDLLTRAEAVTLLNRCLDLLQSTGVKTVVSTSIWFPQKPEKPEMVYVLMNIPYADFYEAEVRNEVEVDAVTSATLNKTRTSSLAGGSYHVKSDGSEITGITFPVLVAATDLKNYKQVTDADRVEITVTNRGQTSTTVYEGKNALFENESYAYYLLAETPAYYKPMELNADGQPVFGKAVGSVETVAADMTLSAESRYGDYQLTVDGLDLNMSADKVYAVVIHTDENDYGLRHVENIWRGTSLAWCTGFTSSVHGSPTSSAHYESMMGQTIRKVTYYTSQGIYEIPAELYVPVKFEGTLSVEDASANAGATTVTVSLPADYDPVYQVEGIEDAAVENGTLTYPTGTEPGEYTLTVSDRSGKYVSLSAKFQLTVPMVYALMNIPYADFYEAEVRNEVEVDAVTSATLNKTRTSSLAGGSYHIKSDGSEITGITFPVLVAATDLKNYKQVTDADRVEITVTNRGQTSTTVYEGKDALFENESYAYYLLAETPAYYKPMELNADGQPVFGKAVGSVETVAADMTLSAESRYGDYQLTVDGLDIDMSADKVYAVVIHTDENDYGLRHVENIWRGTSLAWCTGFTSSVHGSPTSSAHYESMMGQTIRKVTYYTSQGIYEIPAELYVPVKFEGTLSVEDASANAGATTVTVSLPADYDPVYQVEGIEDAAVENGTLTYPTDTEPGEYTLTVSDRSGKYVSLSAKFQLTALMPPEATVTYNSFSGAWEINLGFAEDYCSAVTGVAVNGQPYKKADYGFQAENGNWFFAGTSPYSIGVKGGQAGDAVTITANGYYTLELTLQK